jgi:hypothetical protein
MECEVIKPNAVKLCYSHNKQKQVYTLTFYICNRLQKSYVEEVVACA